jgi:predicted permease
MRRDISTLERALYRRLLAAYPEGFRHRYGHAMTQAFADRRREAARGGPGALLRFWVAAGADVARTGWAERRVARAAARHAGRSRQGPLLVHDLRQGVRSLWRQPVVTLTVVLTMGVGIGANTTVFSAVSGLLGPLPFPAEDRLVQVWQSDPARGIGRANVSLAATAGWIARDDLFDAVGVYAYTTSNVTDIQPPERIPVARVSSGFFDALAVPPLLGRALVDADAVPGAPPVVVVAESLWRSRFGGGADVVGRTVRLDDTTYAIVGVMPERFEHLSWRGAVLWLPQRVDPDNRNGAYRTVARLRTGVGLTAADRALDVQADELSRTFDGWPPGVTITSLRESLIGDAGLSMLFVQAAALAVLLIACANLANLLLAGAAGRRREFAIRASLGAGRWRLIRQSLVESAVLGIAGGLAGLLVARWGVALVVAAAPPDMPRLDQIRLDGTVFAAGLVLAGLTGLAFGLVPALRLARAGVDGSAHVGGRSVAVGRQRPLRGLIVAEVALAVVVLGVSGLLVRAQATLQSHDVGLDLDGVVAAEVSLPFSRYPEADAQRAMFDRMVERVAALPGVERAGLVDTLPLSQSWSQARYRLEEDDAAPAHLALLYRADDGYFCVVGIPLRQGRLFDRTDASGPPVAVVSGVVAARHWPGDTALGKRLWIVQWPEPLTIVGVVGDVRHTSLEGGLEAGVYVPTSQLAPFRGVLVARTSQDPRLLIPAMRAAVAELDPMLPLFNTRTTADLREDALAARTLVTALTGAFAALALVLGAVGVYGIVAFGVVSRRRETGIRIALGAKPGDVARLFLRQGMWLAVVGLALGLIGATAAGLALTRVSADIPPPDVWTFAIVAAVLGAVTLVACYVPARRALRVDPTEVMRGD